MKERVFKAVKFLLRKDNIRDYLILLLCGAFTLMELHNVLVLKQPIGQVFTTLVITGFAFYFKKKI
jgi:hypothetical protein